MLRTLVIDTATHALSVALFDGPDCLAHHHQRVGRGHAEQLMPVVAALPNGGRAEQIVVDVGPGSFTGVRIGVAAARALAFAWNIPVTGYGALSIIAAAVMWEHSPIEAQFPVLITGGHGELFWQMVSTSTGGVKSDLASTPIAALAAMLNDDVVYGTGAEALVAARGWGTAVTVEPDSRFYSRLDTWDIALPATPIYGRSADAKPMAQFVSQ